MTVATRLARADDRVEAPRSPARMAAAVRLAALPVVDAIALAVASLLVGAPATAAAGYGCAVLAVLASTGMHRPRACLRLADDVGRLAAAVSLPPLGFTVLGWLTSIRLAPADRLAALAVVALALLVAGRLGCYAVLRGRFRRGRLGQSTLIVGTGTVGVRLAELITTHPEHGLRVVGFVDDLLPRQASGFELLGSLAELPEVVARQHIQRVIVCLPLASDAELVTLLRRIRPLPARLYYVPRFYELGTPTADRDEVCGIPLLRLHQPGTRGGRVLKRAFDLVFGGLLAVLATPLLLVLAGTIRLTEHAPALFRQRRVVASGRTATMVKLRTVQGEPDPDRPQWTVEDGQCSRLGRWLRASHVDELPQLWNVLRGDMSLVGPRPERPFFADRFAEVIPGYRDRERMPAGLTGWAQVHGYYGDTSIVDRVRFDNAYIERASPWLDLVILARTLPAALSRRRKIVAQQGEQP